MRPFFSMFFGGTFFPCFSNAFFQRHMEIRKKHDKTARPSLVEKKRRRPTLRKVRAQFGRLVKGMGGERFLHFDLREKLNFAMLRTVFFDVFWRCAKIVAQDYRPSPDTGIRTKPFLHVGRPHVLPPVCGPPSMTNHLSDRVQNA